VGTIVVIGVGSCDLGDAGVGLAVAERLRALGGQGIEVVTSLGEPTDLIDAWSGADLAIVVEALVPRGAPGRVRRFDAIHEPLPASRFAASSQGRGVAHAAVLARALAVLPPRLVVFGIETSCFEPGHPLAREVAASAVVVADAILDELRHAAVPAHPPQVVSAR